MTYSQICESVRKLRKQYMERDPFRLCRAMGIILLMQPMGKDPDAVKGFFLESKRIRTITINSDLPETIQRIILAHEICHAVNHRDSGIHAFHEVSLFDQTSRMENDANFFAAEFLLEDREIMEVLNMDTTFYSAASMLSVPAELLDFKFRIMKWKGYKIAEPPVTARSNFLRDIDMPENDDYYS